MKTWVLALGGALNNLPPKLSPNFFCILTLGVHPWLRLWVRWKLEGALADTNDMFVFTSVSHLSQFKEWKEHEEKCSFMMSYLLVYMVYFVFQVIVTWVRCSGVFDCVLKGRLKLALCMICNYEVKACICRDRLTECAVKSFGGMWDRCPWPGSASRGP